MFALAQTRVWRLALVVQLQVDKTTQVTGFCLDRVGTLGSTGVERVTLVLAVSLPDRAAHFLGIMALTIHWRRRLAGIISIVDNTGATVALIAPRGFGTDATGAFVELVFVVST